MRVGSVAIVLAGTVALAACVPNEAIDEIDKVFGAEDERLFLEHGTRRFEMPMHAAMRAMATSLASLDMTVTAQDSDAGYMRASAPAPRPLSDAEWRETVDVELPRMREILSKYAPLISPFVPFEPNGIDIVLDVTFVALEPARTQVTVSMHMVSYRDSEYGPRRAYAPPHGVEIGIRKFWASFERSANRARVSD